MRSEREENIVCVKVIQLLVNRRRVDINFCIFIFKRSQKLKTNRRRSDSMSLSQEFHGDASGRIESLDLKPENISRIDDREEVLCLMS